MLIFAEKYDRNKEEKRKMKRIISILLYMAVLLPLAAQPPKHEVRAAWITAVYGLDWPRTRATSRESIRKQQAELIEILDRLKAANFNTVLFQTRTRGDVLYKSAIEPYNSILTGKVGVIISTRLACIWVPMSMWTVGIGDMIWMIPSSLSVWKPVMRSS